MSGRARALLMAAAAAVVGAAIAVPAQAQDKVR
jgi:hypothetical protein